MKEIKSRRNLFGSILKIVLVIILILACGCDYPPSLGKKQQGGGDQSNIIAG